MILYTRMDTKQAYGAWKTGVPAYGKYLQIKNVVDLAFSIAFV